MKNINIWRESASIILAAKQTFNLSPNYNYKLLCLKRSSKSGVMPNFYVFPGGNMSKSDSDSNWLHLFDKTNFSELIPNTNVPNIFKGNSNEMPKHISLRICAIRETFEECGVLICKTKYNKEISDWASYFEGHDLLKWQSKVHRNASEFYNLCKEYELIPDIWSLKLWSNWVTPVSLPSKFDTVFFLSTFNQVPNTHPEENEIQNLMWASPEEYLIKSEKNDVILPIPQFYEISRLQNFKDINNLLKHASDRAKFGCLPYFPYRIKTKEGIYSIFPGDDLYPQKMDKTTTKVPFLDNLPETNSKNRLLLQESSGTIQNKIFVDNLESTDHHLPPKA